MNTAAYIRVSTDEQANEGNSLTEQKERLAAYCRAMAWTEPTFFIDDGYSAKDTNRPELQKLMKHVEKKQVTKIMVTKLDRLSRRLLDLLTMIEMFRKNEVSFVSVSEQFDTDTPSGRLSLQVLGAVAEFERERIRERVMDNMISLAKNSDKVLTLPCYGYEIEDGRYKINEQEAEHIRFMFELAEQGHGYRMIAKRLNEIGTTTKRKKPWDQVNVKRLMHTETLAGIMIYNKRQTVNGRVTMREKTDWIIKENNHQAIIPIEKFQMVQNILQSRSRAHKHAQNESYLLTGLVKCKYCGKNMRGNTTRHKRENNHYTYYRYICSSYVLGYGCKHHAVHRDDLENAVIKFVDKIASTSDADLKLKVVHSYTVDDEVKEINAQLTKISRRMIKQIQAYNDDLISSEDLKAATELAEVERKKLKDKLFKLENQVGDAQTVRQTAARLIDDIKGVDRIKAKNALRMLIENIEVENDLINITFKV